MSQELTELIVNQIESGLSAMPTSLHGKSDREWTRALKDFLHRLSQEHQGHDVFSAGLDGLAASGEFLFDLVWAVDNRNWGLERVVLIMESEWSRHTDDLRYDFQKLLIGKSAIKLFVFQQASSVAVRDMFNILATMVSEFKMPSPGETYLLAGLSHEANAFLFHRLT